MSANASLKLNTAVYDPRVFLAYLVYGSSVKNTSPDDLNRIAPRGYHLSYRIPRPNGNVSWLFVVFNDKTLVETIYTRQTSSVRVTETPYVPGFDHYGAMDACLNGDNSKFRAIFH